MTTPLLEVRDVSRSFGGVRALSHLSFEVPHGKIVRPAAERCASKERRSPA